MPSSVAMLPLPRPVALRLSEGPAKGTMVAGPESRALGEVKVFRSGPMLPRSCPDKVRVLRAQHPAALSPKLCQPSMLAILKMTPSIS